MKGFTFRVGDPKPQMVGALGLFSSLDIQPEATLDPPFRVGSNTPRQSGP